jgi:hypothetical protein
MHRFETELVAGRKAPYDSWTFVELPAGVAESWGRGPFDVRGSIAGIAFRGRVSRGEGVYRMPVPRPLREQAAVRCGDRVEVAIELDPEPRPVEVPEELRAVLAEDAEVAALFEVLPPSHRRAWTQHVAEAKRAETRERRARKALDGIRAKRFPGQGGKTS